MAFQEACISAAFSVQRPARDPATPFRARPTSRAWRRGGGRSARLWNGHLVSAAEGPDAAAGTRGRPLQPGELIVLLQPEDQPPKFDESWARLFRRVAGRASSGRWCSVLGQEEGQEDGCSTSFHLEPAPRTVSGLVPMAAACARQGSRASWSVCSTTWAPTHAVEMAKIPRLVACAASLSVV